MTRLDGIDVSHWQEDVAPINWDQVKAAGVWWGATKLTQSVAMLDKSAARSRTEMHRVGLRHIGLYHWLSPATEIPSQARWFLSNLGELKVGEFVMCDAEEGGVTIDKTAEWCERVETVTHRPVAVYTGAYVAGIWTAPRVRQSVYGPRPMILAAYTSEAKALALPGVKDHPWHAWQYSSNGPVPGVSGRCDMDRIDNVAIFDVACGLDQPHPAPLPHPSEDMPMIVTNSQTRVNEFDGQSYEPYKFVFVVEEGGFLRHVDGRLPEGACYSVSPSTPAFSNADLDRWPKYVHPESVQGELVESGPMTFTGHLSSVPGDFTLTSG